MRIKEILEGRRIAPSEEGWDRVEEQLGGTVYPRNRSLWRLGIAAGFTGILMISIFWLSRNSDNEFPMENVVTTEKQTEAGSEEAVKYKIPPETQNLIVISGADTGEDRERVFENPEEMIALKKEDENPEVFEEDVNDRFVSLEKLDVKVAQVVSQVNILENSGNQVEDEVIDSLLRVAQEQLLKERVLNSSDTIDAMALLSEVEDDLNKSFRDQLFEKLKEGYLKVRTAVAYRNE